MSSSASSSVEAARGPLRALAAVALLPRRWVGLDTAQIGQDLASELRELLDLDLVALRICDPDGEQAFDISCGLAPMAQLERLGEDIAPWLEQTAAGPLTPLASSDGTTLQTYRIGFGADAGGLVACSRRGGFPEADERCVLEVAAQQVPLALQHLQTRRAGDDEHERLITKLEAISDGVVCSDVAGRIDFINTVARRLFGVGAEVLGEPIDVLGPLLDTEHRRTLTNPAHTALIERRATAQAALLADRKGGERLLEYQAKPLSNSEGELLGSVLVLRDVTDAKRAEQLRAQVEREAEARRRREQQAFRLAPSAMAFTRGPQHMIEAVNERFDTLVGDRALLGRPLHEALPELPAQGLLERFDAAYRSGEPYRVSELHLQLQAPWQSQPVERWIELVLQPMTEADGSVYGILTHAVDLTERVLAERGVRERDQRLQLCLDHATDHGVIVADTDGRIIEWLGGAEKVTGWSAEQAVGATTDLLFTDEDRARGVPQRELREAAERGRVEDNRWHRRADGSRFFADGITVAMRDADGALRGFGKLFRDRTEHKRASDELARLTAESERRRRLYETALSNTPDLVYVFDLEHRFVYANEALLRLWQRRWEDAIGKTFAELGYPDGTVQQLDGDIARVIASGRPVRGEMARPDERIFEYIFTPVFGADGAVEAVAGSTRDVTGRKRSEQRIARVAEASQVLNASLSADCIATALAEHARAIVGCRRATVMLQDDGEPLQVRAVAAAEHDREADALPQRLLVFAEQVGRTGRALRVDAGELQLLGGEQPPRGWPQRGWMAVPLLGHGGRALGLVQLIDADEGEFALEDESVMLQLAAVAAVGLQNAQLYESLRLVDQRKDEFLATLAHELRNPLAPIRYALEVVRGSPKRADRERAREMIGRQLTQLSRLVDDLLDVARISTGKLELRRQRVDLADIVHSAIETSQPTIDAGGQRLQVELPSEPLPLSADPARLVQVLMNLLNNASKYSEAGDTITLRVERDRSQVAVWVRDTGVGIPVPMLRSVFELFSQVEHGERSQGGLGIGLTLVKRLVEMHGGEVEAHSRGHGHGSEFVVRLPLLLLAEEAAVAQAGPSAEPDETPRTVLVVDDNRDAANSLSFLLNTIGHHAEPAHDGFEALAAAERLHPDVVILDIGMPGLNGYEVARRLKSRGGQAPPLLIALTGWGQEQDRRRSRAAGFDHHLVKPADLGELKRLVGSRPSPGASPGPAA